MITHDLGVVAQNVSHVVVMYAGRTVEAAPVADLFENPQHPYSIGLLALAPHLIRARGDRKRRARLPEIGGMVPSPAALPRGCAFAPRCAHADERCLNAVPAFEQKRPGQWAACWHSDRIAGRPPKRDRVVMTTAATISTPSNPLVQVRGLTKHYPLSAGSSLRRRGM